MEVDNMGYIYKITNDINNKIYIGKTCNSLNIRFQQHLLAAKKDGIKNRPLYKAINKYGQQHFHISLVEECSDTQLEIREQYWINYYNSYHNGYNATLGGDGKILYDHDKIKHRLLFYPYPKDVANEFGCSVDLVRAIAKQYNIPIKNKGSENFETNKKIIKQYTKDNKFIQSFSSTVEAAEWCFKNKKCKTLNSGVRGHIADVANGKRKTAYGYIWKY